MKKVEVVLKKRITPFGDDVGEVKSPAYEFGVLGLVVARDLEEHSWMVVHARSGLAVRMGLRTWKQALRIGEELGKLSVDWTRSDKEIRANSLWVKESLSVVRGGGESDEGKEGHDDDAVRVYYKDCTDWELAQLMRGPGNRVRAAEEFLKRFPVVTPDMKKRTVEARLLALKILAAEG